MIQRISDSDEASSAIRTTGRQRRRPPAPVQRSARATDDGPPSSSDRHLRPRPSTPMTSPIRISTRDAGGGGARKAVAISRRRTVDDYHRLTNDKSGNDEKRPVGVKMKQLIPTDRKRTDLASRHQRQRDRAQVLHERNNNSNSNNNNNNGNGNTETAARRRDHRPHRKRRWAASKMLRLIRWPLVHLCLPLCLISALAAAAALAAQSERLPNLEAANAKIVRQAHPTRTRHTTAPQLHRQHRQQQQPPSLQHQTSEEALPHRSGLQARAAGATAPGRERQTPDNHERQIEMRGSHRLARRSPPWASNSNNNNNQQQQQQQPRLRASSLLMPINELRVSGSKLEPPSRPSQDWSRQRPYFGAGPQQRNLSVELGKTAHLVCKVFELGDKTVSWLRPRENEILTAGRFTYVSDPRVSAMNENGSTDWVLEIKDVGLNDSTSYECQVSTDPKLSQIFNLHVQAARARIRNGENNYYPAGANIEFACELLPPASSARFSAQPSGASFSSADQQIYWYHNGNLMNYAKTLGADFGDPGRPVRQNFTIDWDAANQLSRLRLANVQLADAGNYTCKPTAAEPATVRLFVKKPRNGLTGRAHYSGAAANGNAYHLTKEAQRTRLQHEPGADFMESSSSARTAHVIGASVAPIFAVFLFLISATLTAELFKPMRLVREG